MSDTISVMVNSCYGGFGFSKDALDEYIKRRPPGGRKMNAARAYTISRSDPLMVQICQELGSRANGQSACIYLSDIPRKFAEFYVIREYDGQESVHIAFEKYQIDSIGRIMSNSTIVNDDKVTLIKHVLSEKQDGDSSDSSSVSDEKSQTEDDDEDDDEDEEEH